MSDDKGLILVTGATGYVGTVLAPLLVERGWRVRTYDTQHFGNAIANVPGMEHVQGDIRDTVKLAEALKDCQAVIHLAGIVTDALVDMNRTMAFEVNVQATWDLCRLAIENGVRKFVYASSSSVYGALDHDATEDRDYPRPMTYYATTKLMGEALVLAQDRWAQVAAVRSATCMGPAPRMRLDTIVNIFSAQAWFTGEIQLDGGSQWRSNIHVMDAAEFYALLVGASTAYHGQVFNITRGNLRAVHIAEKVKSIVEGDFGKKVDIHMTDKVDERHYRLDAHKAEVMLGWVAKRSPTDAIIDNIAWFQSGGVKDWSDDIYYNTRRMETIVKGGA